MMTLLVLIVYVGVPHDFLGPFVYRYHYDTLNPKP